MALLVVVVLGVPKFATAGQPSVQAPTGPGSGGSFTGTYTFATYISCSGGFDFNSSYSNNLDGTHTFAFYGAADGSLLVSIDGGGLMLVTSCGDPFTPPDTNVANYTVSKNVAPPPTPTPTPTPTPVPTPTPTANPGGGGGGSGGGHTPAPGHTTSSTSTPVAGTTPAPTVEPGAPTPSPTVSTSPSLTASPSTKTTPGPAPATGNSGGSGPLTLAWTAGGFSLLGLVLLILWGWRSAQLRERLRSAFTPVRLRLEPYWFRLRTATRRLAHIHGRSQSKSKGLSAHHHTGKLLAHHHTSYPALAFLILVSTVVAAATTLSSQAASSSLLTFTVPGPPPTAAASIDQPLDGQHFTGSTQTVRGTCPTGLGIEVYRNGSFAGSTMCDVNGLYDVLITLVPDQNDLVVRDLDALAQYGPDSPTISVFYDAPPPPPPPPPPTPSPTPSPSPSASPSSHPTATPTPSHHPTPTPSASPKPKPIPAPVLDSAQHFYQGVEIDTPVEWVITVSSGRSPYHITWEWGDGSSDTASLAAAGELKRSHSYEKAGTYQVTVRVKDALGHESVLQVVVIVNGQVTATSLGQSSDAPGNLIVAWPLLAVTGLVVLSFWLGERHKLAMVRPSLAI